MKRLFTALAIAICFHTTYAAVVTSSNAQTVALNFFKTTHAPGLNGHITLTATLKYTQTDTDGTVDFYVFDITPITGFVIISAQDNVIPVLAYSIETHFTTQFRQSGLSDWIQKTAQQVHHTVLQQLQADARINSLWSDYNQGVTPPSQRSSGVPPLLPCTWDQEPYYNADCPIEPANGQRCVTGCVATAMSQIMKYWSYPPQGAGSFSYTDNQANGYSNNIGPLSANFGATNYNWTLMPDRLSGNNSGVATIMSDAGISVAMDYGSDGSGAYVLQVEADGAYGEQNAPCAQHSYPNYFLYNPNTIQGVYQGSYTPANWITLIENELNNGRPVQYQGQDPGVGGHTWVCDGYDANNYLHMNWGWSGQADGYFAINNLSPGSYDFSEDDAALIGIEPPYSVPQPGGTDLCINTQGPLSVDSALTIFSLNPDSVTTGPTNEFGAEQWTWHGAPGEQRGLIKLNLSAIPAGSTIVSATLSLYANMTTINAAAPTYGTNNACYLEQITSPWSYASVDWNNQPAVTTTGEVLLAQSIDTDEDYLNLNIQTFVQNWVNNPAINYGLELKMITSNYYNSMLFCSSAYTDTTRRPMISICYTPPCSASAAFQYQSASGLTEQFTNSSGSQHGYVSYWTFSNSQGIFESSTLQNPLITFVGQPPFSATLIITDSLYSTCRDTVTENITLAANTYCYINQPSFSLDSTALVSSITPDSTGNNFHNSGIRPYIAADQWTFNGIPGENRSMLKFNLTSIPVGSIVTSASISFYADDSSDDGYVNQPTYGTNNPCYLQQITSPWSAMGVTWNTQPSVTAAGELLLQQSTGISQNYTYMDVTTLVQNWVNNPASNYGLMLKMITQDYYNSMIFCGSSFWDSTRRPRLDICYIGPPCNNSASFTYTVTTGTTVQFANTSLSPHGYSSYWTFYNGHGAFANSTAQNPLITFTGPAPFSATLIITDLSHGCSDTATQSVVNPAGYTCVNLNHSSNAFLPNNAVTTNYGGFQNFVDEQWTVGGVPVEVRSLLQYDLSQIPLGSSILNATLNLYADSTQFSGEPTQGNNNAGYLKMVTSPWNEFSVTWSTQPSTETANEVLLAQSANNDENYLNLNVTNLVQEWVNNPDANYGLMSQMITPNYYNVMSFCSGTNADSARWPVLTICYDPPLCSDTASFAFENTTGSNFQFTNTSSAPDGCISNWTFYNSQGAFATSTLKNPLINYTGQPPYSATLVVTDSLSPTCTDSINHTVIYRRCITLQNSPSAITSFLATNYPTTNLANETESLCLQWTVNGVPAEGRSLIQYDLSQIPTGSTILSATLNLYADTNNYNGYQHEPTYGAADSSVLELVTSPWGHYTVTWDNQPTITGTNAVPLAQSTSYEENYLNLDVSNFVQQWVDNPATNYGMMLKIVTPYYYNCLVFGSGVYGDTTLRPQLNICYSTALDCPDSALFSYHDVSGTTVQFTNNSISFDGYYSQWTFYNSQGQFATSTVKNPLITFAGQPPYSARLVITDSVSAACMDTATQIILINPVTTCVTQQQQTALIPNTYIFSLAPDSNESAIGFKNFPAMQWTWQGVPGQVRGLIKFDLSAIPVGALIQSARLSLYADDTTEISIHPGQPTFGTNNSGYLLPITSPWDLSAVTWNNQPATTSTGEILLAQSANDEQNYLNMDVSGLVQNWVSSPAQNYGLMLQLITQNYYNSLIFASSSNADTSWRPKLDICYITSFACDDTASFTYINSSGVAVQFTNTSTDPNGYTSHWTFYNSQGAFATSTAQNPFVDFTGQPPFSATLVITDNSTPTCKDTISQIINVQTGPGCAVLQPYWSVDSEAIVVSIRPDSNYNSGGATPYLLTSQWTYQGTPGESRSYLKFDLSSLPSGIHITSATLSLFADDSSNNGYTNEPTYGTTNACYLQRITAPWSALGITWNTQPSADTTGQVLLPQSINESENYGGLDVKNFVQQWINYPDSNFGLRIKMIAQNYYNSMIFYSSYNGAGDSTYRPLLNICYDVAATCSDTAFYTWNDTHGDSVQFTNSSISANGYICQWTFYNSQGVFATSNLQNPLIAFVGEPPFSATLQITDSVSSTCTDSLNLIIFVQTTCSLPVTVNARGTACNIDTGTASVAVTGGASPIHYTWSNGQTTSSISNLTGGIYQVTVSDSTGCSAIGIATIDTAQLPNVIISADTTTICPGQSATICAPAGYVSYSWNSGQSTACISAQNAGNYYVTVSDGVNCTATSNHLALTVLAAPSISISESGDTLTCYNGTHYQWYVDSTVIPGANSSIYVASQSGSYIVQVTDSDGCQAQSNAIYIATGIESIDAGGNILVYPNPLKDGYWILEVSAGLVGSKVEMYDIKGSIVSEFNIEEVKTKIPLSPEPGVYVLRVISGANIYIRKLVKL